MSVLRISQRWTFAAVILSILAYGMSEEDSVVLVVGIVGAFASWLITRGDPPKAVPRLMINLLLFCVVSWGTLSLLRGGLGVTLFSQFVMALLVVKLLDRRGPRDTAQLLTLSVFLVLGAILTSNSFAVGVLMLAYLPIIIVAVLWYQLSRVDAGRLPASPDRTAISVRKRTAFVVAGALPIGAVIFLLMPREIGSKTLGAWGAASVGSVVGFNDEVRLGMGGLISQSQEPVLDMELFDRDGQPVGDVGQRFYLRGAILHEYDSETGTWARSDDIRYAYQAGPQPQVRAVFQTVGGAQPGSWNLRQEITIRSVEGNRGHLFSVWQTNQIQVDPPFQLQFAFQDAALRVRGDSGKVSYTAYSTDNVPPPLGYDRPTEDDRLANIIDIPSVRTIAVRVLERADIEPDPLVRPVEEDARAVSALRNYLTGGEFKYTLETNSAPPGRDPVEWFLSENKEGHCEYYASALALMCRTVGIGARVITGYVATDYNAATKSYIVRASNAHAWVEAEMLPDDWRTVDPTPSADLARIHEPPSGMIADVRRFINTLEFAWIRTVIGYDGDARRDLLGNRADRPLGQSAIAELNRATQRARYAPLWLLIEALRNALFGFCIVVFGGVVIVREHRRLRRLGATLFRRVLRLFGATPPRSRAEYTRAEFVRCLRAGGAAKPGWKPLGAYTAELRNAGIMGGETALAASRIVDGIYADLFAERAEVADTSIERDLGIIRKWSKARRKRARTTAHTKQPAVRTTPPER